MHSYGTLSIAKLQIELRDNWNFFVFVCLLKEENGFIIALLLFESDVYKFFLVIS
jgi:hypothetical protein